MNVISCKEAKAAGLKRYYTGVPCKHGHDCERFVSTRGCYFCLRENSKSYNQVPDNKEKMKVRRKQYYEENAEALREYSRKDYWENREARQASCKAWKAENKDRTLASAREYRQKNLERVKEVSRVRYHRNLEKMRAEQNEWRAANVDHVRARVREYNNARYRAGGLFKVTNMMRKHLTRTLNGAKKQKSTAEYLGYESRALMAHLESLFDHGMTWENHGEWHIDHIIPIRHFLAAGVKCPSIINAMSNLRPIWAKENLTSFRMPTQQDIDTIRETYAEALQ